MGADPNQYAQAQRRRQKRVDMIIGSPSDRKIVVGGPGTGKTFLFKQLLEEKSNALTLTFVNSLVEDLSLELLGLSEVRTLHGFARSVLTKAVANDVKIFPKLSKVIRQDAEILLRDNVDFDSIFNMRADEPEPIEFYRRRRIYYEHYGFSDVVYGAVRYFEENPDAIPKYSQIVVDEFQDFNALEVALIDLLASCSPVLLAGDDDQALYGNLKSASAGYIRERHSDTESEYESFTLPYCSRSTRVIVDAANDIVNRALECQCLQGRIDKPFEYFPDQEKDQESIENPWIIHAQVFSNQIPWFIQEQIRAIADEVRHRFTVLLISPTRAQSRRVVHGLREKGFQNVNSPKSQRSDQPTLLEGLRLLVQDGKSNLGWRVVARHLLSESKFPPLLEQTAELDEAAQFREIVPKSIRKEANRLIRALRAVRDDKVDENEEVVASLLEAVGVNAVAVGAASIRGTVKPSKGPQAEHAIRKIPIAATTIPGSKGLSADYVFITHFDDRFFIKERAQGQVTDEEVCSFLVAITRARRRVYLISTDKRETPTLLTWIDAARIDAME
ncbi:MAG: ATP-dependent helicase [Chloroflexi bacterium]|nr:ATP-dependent helicase [Chloroflexota bacterium]